MSLIFTADTCSHHHLFTAKSENWLCVCKIQLMSNLASISTLPFDSMHQITSFYLIDVYFHNQFSVICLSKYNNLFKYLLSVPLEIFHQNIRHQFKCAPPGMAVWGHANKNKLEHNNNILGFKLMEEENKWPVNNNAELGQWLWIQMGFGQQNNAKTTTTSTKHNNNSKMLWIKSFRLCIFHAFPVAALLIFNLNHCYSKKPFIFPAFFRLLKPFFCPLLIFTSSIG